MVHACAQDIARQHIERYESREMLPDEDPSDVSVLRTEWAPSIFKALLQLLVSKDLFQDIRANPEYPYHQNLDDDDPPLFIPFFEDNSKKFSLGNEIGTQLVLSPPYDYEIRECTESNTILPDSSGPRPRGDNPNVKYICVPPHATYDIISALSDIPAQDTRYNDAQMLKKRFAEKIIFYFRTSRHHKLRTNGVAIRHSIMHDKLCAAGDTVFK